MFTHTHAQSGAFSPSPVSQDASEAAQVGPWTPAHHVSVSQSKPVRLLDLGAGPHGRNALLAFPDAWTRSIDLPTEADAWHPLFDGLPQADRDRLREHVAAEKIRQADGTYLQRGFLSFTTRRLNRRQVCQTRNLFDVPPQTYARGDVTGYRCAAEFLEALGRGYGPYIDIFGILTEVARAAQESCNSPSRSGAAQAFMEVMGDGLTFLAKHGNHGSFMAQKIATADARANHWTEIEARERAQFIQRMQEARRKKREARQKAGTA